MNQFKAFVIITALLMSSTLSGFVSAQSSTAVVWWMYENNLTIFDNQEDFGWDRQVTRGEIAKFFTKFAILIGKEKVKTTEECQFNDIDGYDYTLVPNIIEACEYGLMKWSNGSYFPNKNLTEAEWLTVIIRAVVGMQDETGDPRWSETHWAAERLGILDGESISDLDTPSTRWKIGTWLYKASKVDPEGIKKEWSVKLKDLLNETFGEDLWEGL